jgi:hypothetical protein
MKQIFYSIIFILLVFTKAEAIDITATGSWNRTIDTSDLASGAGSDLIGIYESTVNATVLTVFNTTGNTDNWRIDVRRSDSTWHGDFILYIQRTSDGTGGGSITGGLSYIAIGTTDSQFFSGAGDRSSVNLQYKLTGMSISIPPNTYSTTVVFTIVDVI